ncbi:MAG TPA: membrane lipoprotein lipid attachment site-containing protein [Bacteroidales bacterium]|nr:membrane lipoprotein lipid attachment site-containing protein [Bacteroidales bacterium]HRZ50273.1 membrane lipoprotein lipid attachment site-containing protein [Bacteroidales bacterium]
MKKIIITLAALLILAGCSKEYEARKVTYLITGLGLPYKMAYMNEAGETVMQNVTPVNDGDIWTYSFDGKQGDIVYLFAEFKDVELVPTKFKFRILIDGKTYKESYGYDQTINDTLFRVKRSGVVPF